MLTSFQNFVRSFHRLLTFFRKIAGSFRKLSESKTFTYSENSIITNVSHENFNFKPISYMFRIKNY